MVRRSALSNRTRLSVTQLEARDVPAGTIEVGLGGGLGILGDNDDNHVRVEKSGAELRVTSDSGPIRYYDSGSGQFVITAEPVVFYDYVDFFYYLSCEIQTGNGDDLVEVTGDRYYSLGIATESGNDQILVNANTASSRIDTGIGADLVTLRDCDGIDGWLSYTSVFTARGDDRVVLQGTNHFGGLYISLGMGNDIVEGDATPGASLACDYSFAVYGGKGDDSLVTSSYFIANAPPSLFIDGIEETN